ncbi:related to MRL1 Mannose 6-phosphate Receptor Like [Cephalotrichum gorgonifer]|uniref:Related to MRL1 Mannose 6-phosphate Receptor Like n=1 Tax=Cephalotrichum gorgonifer TaxID=2041049 RepID=A0AAE8MWX4_9PEZI|nr:related to MRL1 Mannose 6-phosphate Receptor Like [Cephalotrichum gorgonifer]
MRFTQLFLLAAPALAASDTATATATTEAADCTATATAGFFDLRPDTALAPGDGVKKSARTADYHANGWDYRHNFTMNICGAVVKPVEDVVGVDEEEWRHVGAYYTSDGGDVFSIGSESKLLHTRGRKLVLQYTNGSPCGPSSRRRRSIHDGAMYGDYSDDEDAPAPSAANLDADDDQRRAGAEEEKEKEKDKKEVRRKSATISFLCDHDPADVHATVNFVGTDPDECAYFFDVRSQHACLSAEPHQPGSVGPGGVFALLLSIALVVYFAGGVFYQRTVAHARGWRQLPNHTLWHGIWTAISDFAIIGASSCARLLPGRQGYSRLSRSPTSGWRNREDENRLIDQLDEEWDD